MSHRHSTTIWFTGLAMKEIRRDTEWRKYSEDWSGRGTGTECGQHGERSEDTFLCCWLKIRRAHQEMHPDRRILNPKSIGTNLGHMILRLGEIVSVLCFSTWPFSHPFYKYLAKFIVEFWDVDLWRHTLSRSRFTFITALVISRN